jgi:anti-sigma regulatory factor (Ser/Thr protein kinase)
LDSGGSGYFEPVTVINGEFETRLDPERRGSAEGTSPLELSLPADSASVALARHSVADFARGQGADPDDVALAVSEAVSNAIVHAFRGREPGTIDIRAFADGAKLVVSISDDGVGVTPNPDSPGLGLGLALIGSLTEGIELRRDGHGTTLVMRFPRTT